VGVEELDISKWLQALDDSSEPCGKDLEYDNVFLDLNKTVRGKPETQFGPGEPPNWREVRELAEDLMTRTRDLRVALIWLRSVINLNGFSGLPAGLQLVEGLLTDFWDHLHPMPDPDDGDMYARANALAVLPQIDGVLGDLRQCVFFSIRGVGELRFRTVEIALGQVSAKPDESAMTREQLIQMIASAFLQKPELRDQIEATLSTLKSLAGLMNDRFGVEATPDLRPIVTLVKSVQGLLPAAMTKSAASEENDETTLGAAAFADATGGTKVLGQINSRDDALRAIDMVCGYLERTEPTNPAQLMLRRARRLINHNFLQLMKELAPEALNEVARVMGVDPDTIISEI